MRSPNRVKTEVVPTKSYRTQRDLALAYSPGVAIPCQEIEKQLENVYKIHQQGQSGSGHFQWELLFWVWEILAPRLQNP